MKKKEEKKLNNNIKSVIIAILCIIPFTAVAIGTAYSFIAAKIIGNEDNGELTVKSAQVYAVFEGTDLIGTDILPGYTDSLTFTVTYTSTTKNTYGNYSIVWNINKNEITSNSFVYKVEGKTYKDGKEVTEDIPHNKLINVVEARVPQMSTVLGTGTINTGVTHKYTLTIMFKETGSPQNEFQKKEFNSTLAAKGEPIVD